MERTRQTNASVKSWVCKLKAVQHKGTQPLHVVFFMSDYMILFSFLFLGSSFQLQMVYFFVAFQVLGAQKWARMTNMRIGSILYIHRIIEIHRITTTNTKTTTRTTAAAAATITTTIYNDDDDHHHNNSNKSSNTNRNRRWHKRSQSNSSSIDGAFNNIKRPDSWIKNGTKESLGCASSNLSASSLPPLFRIRPWYITCLGPHDITPTWQTCGLGIKPNVATKTTATISEDFPRMSILRREHVVSFNIPQESLKMRHYLKSCTTAACKWRHAWNKKMLTVHMFPSICIYICIRYNFFL